MLAVLRFWLDRGVDGFRVDALRQVHKDPEFRDNPPNPEFRDGLPEYDSLLPVRSADHDDLAPATAMAEVIAERGGVMVGELYLPFERLVRYYGAGVHMPSNMHLISAPWEPRALADLVERYEAALPDGAWPNWVLGNHDRSRLATRLGAAQARVAAVLLCTLRGTPTLYYGDELGMPDVPIPPERVQDPYEHNSPGLGVGRDPARTPMPWSAAPNGGFCPPEVEPWLPLGDVATINVEAEREDPRSMLNLYRRLLALRRASPALTSGGYRTLVADEATFAYLRDDTLVALNLSDEPQTLALAGAHRADLVSRRPRGRRGGRAAPAAGRGRRRGAQRRLQAGLTAAPRRRTSKCRCGPVETPVEPTAPIRAPAATQAPRRTRIRDRCAYQLVTPLPWLRTTSLP